MRSVSSVVMDLVSAWIRPSLLQVLMLVVWRKTPNSWTCLKPKRAVLFVLPGENVTLPVWLASLGYPEIRLDY